MTTRCRVPAGVWVLMAGIQHRSAVSRRLGPWSATSDRGACSSTSAWGSSACCPDASAIRSGSSGPPGLMEPRTVSMRSRTPRSASSGANANAAARSAALPCARTPYWAVGLIAAPAPVQVTTPPTCARSGRAARSAVTAARALTAMASRSAVGSASSRLPACRDALWCSRVIGCQALASAIVAASASRSLMSTCSSRTRRPVLASSLAMGPVLAAVRATSVRSWPWFANTRARLAPRPGPTPTITACAGCAWSWSSSPSAPCRWGWAPWGSSAVASRSARSAAGGSVGTVMAAA